MENEKKRCVKMKWKFMNYYNNANNKQTNEEVVKQSTNVHID